MNALLSGAFDPYTDSLLVVYFKLLNFPPVLFQKTKTGSHKDCQVPVIGRMYSSDS